MLSYQPYASAQWYAGPGFTNLSLSSSNSTVSLNELNNFIGAAATETRVDVAGSANVSLALGYSFGPDNQWSIETTIAPAFDETIKINDEVFATAELLPLNIFAIYHGRGQPIGDTSASLRLFVGAGLIKASHSDIRIANTELSQLPSTTLELSDSTGASVIIGANMQIRKQLSLVAGLGYVTKLGTDVSIQNIQLPIPFTPAFDLELGNIDIVTTIITGRIQYSF